MDKKLEGRFDRVEKALGALTDSITTYKPSAHLANDFATADDELSKGLEELQTHQRNYRKIEQLRAATTSLDGQIKDTLRLLANTRKELVNAPATIFPSGPQYEIKYDELLNYAHIISRTTIPPAGAINALPTADLPDAGGLETAATTPGIATAAGTAANTPAATNTPNGGGGAPQLSTSTPAATTTTNNHIPEHLHAHLNPNSQIEFVPWPDDNKIRQGSLAALARLAERGIDPENYDPEAEKLAQKQAAEEEKRREEEERRQREEKERRMREEQIAAQQRAAQRQKEEAEAWQKNNGGAGGAAQGGASSAGAGAASSSPIGEKKQFHFMEDDSDDSDD